MFAFVVINITLSKCVVESTTADVVSVVGGIQEKNAIF